MPAEINAKRIIKIYKGDTQLWEDLEGQWQDLIWKYSDGTTVTTKYMAMGGYNSAMLLNSSDYFDENNIVYKTWGYVGNKVYVAFSGTTIKFYSSNSTVDGTQNCMLLGSIPGRGEMFFPVLSSITAY